MNKLVKNTDTVFIWHMQWAPSTIQTKTDREIYIWLEGRHAGYMTKKVAIHMVAVYHVAHLADVVHVAQSKARSTDTV